MVTRGWMLDRGYNFDFHTSVVNTKSGEYHFCFEFGHWVLEDGRIMVVQSDRY